MSSSFCLASVCENNWKNVCWKTALFSLVLTHIIKGGESIHIVSWLFFMLPRFSMVSELDFSLLEHVVINNDFEFCLRDMSRQGGSWLFCYFILKQVQY